MRTLSPVRAAITTCILTAAVTVPATRATAQVAPGSQLTFSGAANAQDVGLPGVVLDFQTPATVVRGTNTGSFAYLNGGADATSGTLNSIRVGNGPQSVPTFLSLGGYTFDLMYVPSGPHGQADCYVDPAPGQFCTPFQSLRGDPTVNAGLSPFYLANTVSTDPSNPINSTASFNVFGTVSDPGGASSYFFGTISSFFPGVPYQYVLGGLEQAGDADQSVPVPFTGTIVAGFGSMSAAFEAANGSVVPEPSSYALVGAGLLGVAGVVRRRRRA